MKHLFITILALFLLFEALPAASKSDYKSRVREYPGTHNTSDMVITGCRSCHAGSQMNRSITDTCMQCHGSGKEQYKAEGKRLLSKSRKFLKAKGEIDMRDVLEKTYTHPVGEAKGVHTSIEEMPETDSDMPRHVECTDCHHHHYVREDNVFAGVKGVNKDGQTGAYAAKEYEVCFRCHSDSVNLPVDQTNKRVDFDLNNPSYHPVVGEGRSGNVPSLIKPYREAYKEPGDISIIKCTDCHGNNNKREPKGPHGSDYRFILVKKYSILDERSERPQDYELCYGCHKRSSILGDISFKYHSLHIKGRVATGLKGTSCYTCHDAHGSEEYTHLIRFNGDVVFRNTSTDELKFVDKGQSQGECSLFCHSVNHTEWNY